jgi:hypothetical protein
MQAEVTVDTQEKESICHEDEPSVWLCEPREIDAKALGQHTVEQAAVIR